MDIFIGSEQELVTGFSTPSTSVTTLNGTVDTSSDVITLANSALVNIGEVIRAEFEKMLVRDINTTTHQASVQRGFDRTNRVQHLDKVAVDVYRTFIVERGVNGTTAATHAKDVAISRYLPPDDVLGLCRQMAVLNINKSRSGYAGKIGNDQTGVTYYNDEVPRYYFDRIKDAYQLP